MNFINDNLNIFIGSVIFIILGIVGYFLNSNIKQNNIINEPQIIIKEDNIINNYLEKEFSKVLKVFSDEVKKSAQSMVKFNDKFLLNNDYLNFRNSLYTKDLEKHHILIDTKNINSTDKHSYKIKFDSNGNNESGGYGVFKNVIGFRLIKCTLQNLHYNIHDGNKTFIFQYNGGGDLTITLDTKSYDSESDIATELALKMNAAAGTSTDITVTYDSSTRKYTISHPSNMLILLFSDTTISGSSIYRLLGFNNCNTGSLTSHTSQNVADISIHYVDLEVKEIPYIACKKNPTGKSIIDRIPLDAGLGSIVHYRSPTCEYFSQNYFFPITLSELNINLYEDTHNIHYYNENSDNFFEFEVTLLKNTKLSN